jgi:hypothetical protein
MADLSIERQLQEQISKLSAEQQRRVLDFVHSLRGKLPPGIPGEVLVRRAREIQFDPDDLTEMERAIEEGCERVDWSEW